MAIKQHKLAPNKSLCILIAASLIASEHTPVKMGCNQRGHPPASLNLPLEMREFQVLPTEASDLSGTLTLHRAIWVLQVFASGVGEAGRCLTKGSPDLSQGRGDHLDFSSRVGGSNGHSFNCSRIYQQPTTQLWVASIHQAVTPLDTIHTGVYEIGPPSPPFTSSLVGRQDYPGSFFQSSASNFRYKT